MTIDPQQQVVTDTTTINLWSVLKLAAELLPLLPQTHQQLSLSHFCFLIDLKLIIERKKATAETNILLKICSVCVYGITLV